MKENRAPFQVIVAPFLRDAHAGVRYAVLRRSTDENWQFIAGGGHVGEDELQAAKREANEEAGIPMDAPYFALLSMATIPVVNVAGFLWGSQTLVIPEYCFGVEVFNSALRLSSEHSEFAWLAFDVAARRLKWDSNKNALWELNHRICNNLLTVPSVVI